MVALKSRVKARIPLEQRVLARSLYVTKGLSHKEIAKRTGLNEVCVRQLAHREKWVSDKAAHLDKVQQAIRASDNAMVRELVEAHKLESGRLSLGALKRVEDAINDDSTNEFGEKLGYRYLASAAKAARDLTTIFRDAAGLNTREPMQVNIGLNSFAAPKQTLPEPTEIEVRSST